MKLTPWFSCKEEPPVNFGGPYEYRLWDHGSYIAIIPHAYYSGAWYDKYGSKLTGIDRPGWHKKDQWRGVFK